ncbi:arginase-1-like isoform X2 [Montipora capricornis]|uniref:arginase-1-like isoform X2 n=1 Tax=Montipora capricornis TaxID=246305 RepID=UPI0035F1FBCE
MTMTCLSICFSRLPRRSSIPTQILRCYHQKEQRELFLIGVPFSGGQPRKGVEEGPAHLRKCGLVTGLKKLGCKISDFGELKVPLANSENLEYITRHMRVKNSLECGILANRLSQEIAKATREGKISISLGGDHSIAVGTVFGHASVRQNMCLLWFTPLPGYDWCSPCLSPQNVAYIGLRDIDPGEKEIAENLGIAAYTIDDIDKEGIGEIIHRALERINPEGDRPIHVSYDIDSLDPKEARSTGTPVKGGLTIDEGIYISQIVAQTGCLSAIDMVEFNPAIGTEEEVSRTALNTMKLITILLGEESHLKEAPLPPVDKKEACGNGVL